MKSAVSASFEFRFQTHLTDDLHVSDVETGRRELGRIYAQLNQLNRRLTRLRR